MPPRSPSESTRLREDALPKQVVDLVGSGDQLGIAFENKLRAARSGEGLDRVAGALFLDRPLGDLDDLRGAFLRIATVRDQDLAGGANGMLDLEHVNSCANFRSATC